MVGRPFSLATATKATWLTKLHVTLRYSPSPS